jgi:hypothetical protein
MKISMNAVNNYSLQVINQYKKPGQIKNQHADSLSKDEKTFFAGVYPESKNEIMDYHYYSKDGKMSGVATGSNINRRG